MEGMGPDGDNEWRAYPQLMIIARLGPARLKECIVDDDKPTLLWHFVQILTREEPCC